MNDYKNNILNKDLNVNTIDKDFFDFILKEELKDKSKEQQRINEEIATAIAEKPFQSFFSRIPECQLSAVRWKIKNQFNGNVKKYVDSRNLFVEKFTLKMRDVCNEVIKYDDKERRNKNKIRKNYLLYSSQLLNLVGKNGSKYINDSLLNIYKKELQEQEEFLKLYRLISADGSIFKLTDLETKAKIQLARILKISSALSQIAKDRHFEYSLITLTLPPCFHANPKKGSSASYDGALPSQGKEQLEKFWADIRANLSKKGLKMGDDMFGCSVPEAHESSVLHKHVLLYHSKENKQIIDNVVWGVQNRARTQYNSKLNFDISNYDEKKGGAGASYIFKYITKTCGPGATADKNTLKNMAVRWYYSARAFNFFGIKQVTTKFNFLCENYKKYDKAFSEEINEMFSSFDYYTFITKYEKYFSIVRDDNKKVNFVTFDLDGNNLLPIRIGVKNTLIIEKKIFSIFEVNETTKTLECINDIFKLNANLKNADALNFESLEVQNVVSAYEYVKDLENKYKDEVYAYASENTDNTYLFEDLDLVVSSFFSNRVTVNQSLSSRDLSLFENQHQKDKNNPKKLIE